MTLPGPYIPKASGGVMAEGKEASCERGPASQGDCSAKGADRRDEIQENPMTKTLSEAERPTANTGDVNVTELRNWAEEAEREIAKGGFTFKQRGTFRCLIGYALQAADALDRLGIISTVPDNEKLKPCGQCGSTDTGYLFGGKDADSCAAMCDDCGHKIVAPTIEEARIKWNAAYGTPNERAELAEKLQMALDIATPESGLLKADDVKRVIAILRATPLAAALSPLHFKLLRRGTRGTYIGLSDDMELRMAEMGALHDLHRLGFATYAEQPKHDGPKSPRSSVITDAGRTALRTPHGLPGERENGARPLPIDREMLGRMVREAWVRWAQTQPNPKPSWLVPYDELSEPDKEADRQIGEAIARWTLIYDAANASLSTEYVLPTEQDMLNWLMKAEIDYQTIKPACRECGPLTFTARAILSRLTASREDGKNG